MPSDLTLVVVAKDRESLLGFQAGDPDGARIELIANDDGKPLAAIGNRHLDAAQTSIFGLCHADCIFNARSLAEFALSARFGVVGIVGIDSQYAQRWCYRNPGVVETLDSCSVFFSRSFGLRFDERTCDGFHGHVQDLCMQARAKGIPVFVPAADATHIGINFAEPAWRADYERYKARLCEKWGQKVKFT